MPWGSQPSATQTFRNIRTYRSGVWVAKQTAVAAAGGARSWAGVPGEVTFSSPPDPTRSPIERDSESHCGTGGLFPSRGLGRYGCASVEIRKQGWPGGGISKSLVRACSPVVPNRERTVVCNCESPGRLRQSWGHQRSDCCDKHRSVTIWRVDFHLVRGDA